MTYCTKLSKGLFDILLTGSELALLADSIWSACLIFGNFVWPGKNLLIHLLTRSHKKKKLTRSFCLISLRFPLSQNTYTLYIFLLHHQIDERARLQLHRFFLKSRSPFLMLQQRLLLPPILPPTTIFIVTGIPITNNPPPYTLHIFLLSS